MKIERSERLANLPPYPFVQLDNIKREAIKKGLNIIDFSVGDPDLPTHEPIVEKLAEAGKVASNHRYPQSIGSLEFRASAVKWYEHRFGVKLNPGDEITTLIGSKEGLAHIPLAFVNSKDVVLVPDPAYPVYNVASIFAGGKPFFMPLLEKNNWLIDIGAIPKSILKKTKMMFLNYPNNPTGAVADKSFFKDVVKLAQKYKFIVCHDAAYTEMFYDKQKPISFLGIPGAKKIGIEFHSLSKTFNMTGWRIGFAVGNKDLIAGLSAVKGNIDSGVFQAIQEAGITAFSLSNAALQKVRDIYNERMETLVIGLYSLGWKVQKPSATFYLWVKIPAKFAKMKSNDFCGFLLEKCNVVVTPGTAFGRYGEGYIRMSVTVESHKISEALERLKICK